MHHLTVSQHQIHLTRGLAGCLKLACKRMRHQDWSRIRASSWWWGFDSPKWDLWGSKLLNEAIGQRGWPYKPFSRAHRDDFGNEHPFGFIKQWSTPKSPGDTSCSLQNHQHKTGHLVLVFPFASSASGSSGSYDPHGEVSYNSVINACAQKGRVSRAVPRRRFFRGEKSGRVAMPMVFSFFWLL